MVAGKRAAPRAWEGRAAARSQCCVLPVPWGQPGVHVPSLPVAGVTWFASLCHGARSSHLAVGYNEALYALEC